MLPVSFSEKTVVLRMICLRFSRLMHEKRDKFLLSPPVVVDSAEIEVDVAAASSGCMDGSGGGVGGRRAGRLGIVFFERSLSFEARID